MQLVLEVIEGPDLGKKFTAKLGTRIGRLSGEIQLDDRKVSGLHAMIEQDASGNLVMVDLDSSNGLKIDGNLVKRLVLVPGVIVQVGRTFLKVRADEFVQEKPPVPQPPKDWREALDFWVSKIPLQNTPAETADLRPFDPTIKLQFIEGIEADREVWIGFGPRRAGADELDILLQDQAAPEHAFELRPETGGALFETNHPEVVRLNDIPTSSELLRDGDLIRLGKTLIRIKLVYTTES